MNWEAETEAVPLTFAQEEELRSLAVSRAAESLDAVDAARTDEELFYALPEAAVAAYQLGDLGRAKELAEQLLAIAPSYRNNWNFGNAIHFGHSALGLIALEEDDVRRAMSELAKAGATPGSPQLDTFGPTMQLAKALLKRGESGAVLAYIESCRSFWRLGDTWLDLWQERVLAGKVPNCFLHAFR
jgi:tetratricopeptide (TPR) repeat protein